MELQAKRTARNQQTRDRLLAKTHHDYPLTPADEHLILLYYHQKINDICKYFKLPTDTTLTAHLIFSTVHISKPLLDERHDLKHVMLATVYLASKVDDGHTNLVDFSAKIPGTDRRVVEELEFVLLDWLDFDILFHSPLPPLVAFIIDVFGEDKCAGGVYSVAVPLIVAMYMTDIPLLHNPTIISLAALKSTADKLKDRRFDEYLAKLQERDPSIRVLEQVQSVLAMSAVQATTLDARLLKEIDGKLTECRRRLTQ